MFSGTVLTKYIYREAPRFRTLGQAKRLVVTVFGFTILATGIAMTVKPGPVLVVISAGLAVQQPNSSGRESFLLP